MREGAAQAFVWEGEQLARKRDVIGAVSIFSKALGLSPSLNFDPEQKARRLAAQSLVHEGEILASQKNIEGAVGKFQEALELDRTLDFDAELYARQCVAMIMVSESDVLAREQNFEAAISSIDKALDLDPTLDVSRLPFTRWLAGIALLQKANKLVKHGRVEEALAKYAQAAKFDPPVESLATACNELCWFGSLWGHATEVVGVCERAVTLDPQNGVSRDSRGLARALTGDHVGAIKDFQFYLDWEQGKEPEEFVRMREDWIRKLQAGQNPFDVETLEALRSAHTRTK